MSSGAIYNFATVFLTLAPRQKASFLAHISKTHCEYIRQSAYNLLLNSSIELSSSERAYLRRNSSAIRRLASKRVCVRDKRGILAKKAGLITKIFQIVVGYIKRQRELAT